MHAAGTRRRRGGYGRLPGVWQAFPKITLIVYFNVDLGDGPDNPHEHWSLTTPDTTPRAAYRRLLRDVRFQGQFRGRAGDPGLGDKSANVDRPGAHPAGFSSPAGQQPDSLIGESRASSGSHRLADRQDRRSAWRAGMPTDWVCFTRWR